MGITYDPIMANRKIENYFFENHNIIPALSGLTSYNEEDTYFELKIRAYNEDTVFLDLTPYLHGVRLENSVSIFTAIMNIAKKYECTVESLNVFSAQDHRFVKMHFQFKFKNSRSFLNEEDLKEVEL